MFDRLEAFDQKLMIFLNGYNNSFMDVVMFYISEPLTWLPVFIFMLYFVYRTYGLKGLGLFILTASLCILVSDKTSVLAFKNVFQRYRPCHNGEIGDLIHIFNEKCGGKYGFVSSHATNFFSLAVLFGSVLRPHYKWGFLLILLWAALISYSRIYLGVHYPFDIIGGALLGITIGGFIVMLFRFLLRKYNLSPN